MTDPRIRPTQPLTLDQWRVLYAIGRDVQMHGARPMATRTVRGEKRNEMRRNLNAAARAGETR